MDKDSCLNCVHKEVCNLRPSSPVGYFSFWNLIRNTSDLKKLVISASCKEIDEAQAHYRKIVKPHTIAIEKEFYKFIGSTCENI
ncbi:unnamed protein product [marine sediment metagenome]|uniref:Uncharacterized protein n=1 Tax=marine sediment metagenome TaxID=412755 RepID=X0UMQ7_9ZZZZ